MATVPARALKFGKTIDKTLGVLERNAGPALIFVVVVTALCVPVSYFGIGSTSPLRLAGGEILRSVIGMICSYFLLVAMVRRTGLRSRTDEEAFLPFIGLSLLSSLGVLLGVIALVLPGLFIMARWMIAPPLLVASGTGIRASLGESWDRTRGSEFLIIGTAVTLLLPLIAVGIAVSVFLEAETLPRIIIAQAASSSASVVFLSLGVALYGMMYGPADSATPTS